MTNLVWPDQGLKSGRRGEYQTINRRSHGTAPTQAWQGQEFHIFSKAARPILVPTQPRMQWVPGELSPGIKRPGREANHSRQSNTQGQQHFIMCIDNF
jgi:hypothetical protein